MAEKTEAPTARRLMKAREDGSVAKSNELNNAVSLLVGTILLSFLMRPLVSGLQQVLTNALALRMGTDLNAGWLWIIIYEDVFAVGPWLGLFMAGMAITGVIVNVAQTGLMVSTSKLGFHLERINPFSRLGQMVSLHGLVELGKAIVKLVLIGSVVYAFLQEHIFDLLNLTQLDLRTAISKWSELAYDMMLRAAFAYAILALADYFFQRWNWMRGLKMTKEEVKEDNKMSEGDPFIKGRIRQQMRKIARMRMMSNVKKADVIITNPTHLALALAYDAQKMKAPHLLAKGADRIAEQIVKEAHKYGVPIVQNIPLAHAIFKTVALDQEVPPALYTAMAQVMAYVYRLRGKRTASAASRAQDQPAAASGEALLARATEFMPEIEQEPIPQGFSFVPPAGQEMSE
jgi:flagellar biosynthesis protein FlhB